MSSLLSPILDVIAEIIIPELVTVACTIGKEKSEEKKEQKAELKKAMEADRSEISDELYSDIKRISRDSFIMQSIFLSIACRTNKIIKYATYYLTTDTAKKISCDVGDKELINAIAEMAGIDKVYPEANIADIARFDSSKAESDFCEGYLLDINELVSKVKNQEFIDKAKAKAGRSLIFDTSIPQLSGTVNGLNGRYDDEGYFHPVFFSNIVTDTPIHKQGEGISNEVFNKFENVFKPYFLPEDEYGYEVDVDGNYVLAVSRANAMGAKDRYIIDDGRILGGNRVSILGNFINPSTGLQDTVFVNVLMNPDTVTRILKSAFYIMNPIEASQAISCLFNNGFIYHSIDFSNTEWFDSIGSDKYEFERRLSIVSQIAVEEGDIRLRFVNYTSPYQFILVSDNQVVSTLSSSGATSPNIKEGLTITVLNDCIIKSINGQEIRYNITNG